MRLTIDRLPAGVRTFIGRHLRSIEQCELLLLLYRTREQWWTAENAARELRTSVHSAGANLEHLASHSFLDARTAEQVVFRYQPLSPDLDEGVRDLARAYTERPVAVTTAIYSTPMDEVRGFADAFRIRKGGDGG